MNDPKQAECARCGRVLPIAELNIEAVIHHGASAPECIDRQDCERAKRKQGKRGGA